MTWSPSPNQERAIQAAFDGYVKAKKLEIAISALKYYADKYCEGWCERSNDCAKFGEECGGCLARDILHEISVISD